MSSDIAVTGPDPGFSDPSQDPASLPAQVYQILRERIIRGHYPAGAKLPEQKLAEDLNVSRIPLREAIHQLEMDGFAHSRPRRAAVVWGWTPKAAHDLFDVRLALEVAAAGLAARQAAAGHDLTDLEAALDRQHQSLEGTDVLRIAEASVAFHEAIVVTTDNELMCSLMRSVAGRLVWQFVLTSRPEFDRSCLEHHDLLNTIRSGNEQLAASIAFTHIERGRASAVERITGIS